MNWKSKLQNSNHSMVPVPPPPTPPLSLSSPVSVCVFEREITRLVPKVNKLIYIFYMCVSFFIPLCVIWFPYTISICNFSDCKNKNVKEDIFKINVRMCTVTTPGNKINSIQLARFLSRAKKYQCTLHK